ncbi:VOC family protein [Paenibacillus marinisediminis]
MRMIFAGVCLITDDVPKLAEFYKLILKTTSDCDDTIHQEIRTNGAALAIFNNGEVKETRNENMSIAFEVENVDEEYDRLKSLGVHFIEPPTTRPWGCRSMMFTDPDGNHVVFRSRSL